MVIDVGGPMRVYRHLPRIDADPPVRFGEARWMVVPGLWWSPASDISRERVPW